MRPVLSPILERRGVRGVADKGVGGEGGERRGVRERREVRGGR